MVRAGMNGLHALRYRHAANTSFMAWVGTIGVVPSQLNVMTGPEPAEPPVDVPPVPLPAAPPPVPPWLGAPASPSPASAPLPPPGLPAWAPLPPLLAPPPETE